MVAGTPVNVPLSQQRAAAVASALHTMLPGVTVAPTGKGRGAAVAPNSSPQGRAQNRRAAIVAIN